MKKHSLELGVDRNQDIEKQRKMYQTHHMSEQNLRKASEPKSQMRTSTNFKDHNRNKTKSLVNFLQTHKSETITKSREDSPFTGRQTPITLI